MRGLHPEIHRPYRGFQDAGFYFGKERGQRVLDAETVNSLLFIFLQTLAI